MKNIGPLIINLDDTNLSNDEKNIIKNNLVGGIILFSHNYDSKSQLCKLIDDIRSIKDNIIISIDHEGGRIQRLLKEFTHLPSLEAISNIKNHELRKKIANQSGYVSGYELSEINIDINYSPVVDINHNKENNLLKDRTFGNDINNIVLLANEYINGSLECGVLPVLKHFPGHGRVVTDSHTEGCISDVDINELLKTDILPFKSLYLNHSKFNLPIMTSHIIYSKVDKFVVTYSKEWLKTQSNLIFKKPPIFISDDVEMYSAKVIDNRELSCEERVLLALNAGCRMIIATTMQNNKIIEEKSSYKYFSENYLTDNIIEYYEKNHDKMSEIELPKIESKSVKLYEEAIENMETAGMITDE